MKMKYRIKQLIKEAFLFPRGLIMDRNGAIRPRRGIGDNRSWPGYEHENPGVLFTNRPPEKGSEEK